MNATREAREYGPTHLGKRKRTVSPDNQPMLNSEDAQSLQQRLTDVLEQCSRSETASIIWHLANGNRSVTTQQILKYSIPADAERRPGAKRIRLSSNNEEQETIEGKVKAGVYSTLQEVLDDALRAQDALSPNDGTSQVNGDADDRKSNTVSHLAGLRTVIDAFSKISTLSTKVKKEGSEIDINGLPSTARRAGQVITLRSQTDNGPRQLFSGLQMVSYRNDKILTIYGRR